SASHPSAVPPAMLHFHFPSSRATRAVGEATTGSERRGLSGTGTGAGAGDTGGCAAAEAFGSRRHEASSSWNEPGTWISRASRVIFSRNSSWMKYESVSSEKRGVVENRKPDSASP